MTGAGGDHEGTGSARAWLAGRDRALVGRVVAITGFSTWPGDELMALDAAGDRWGSILGPVGSESIAQQAAGWFGPAAGPAAAGAHGGGQPAAGLRTATVSVQGAAVAAAGLSCGGSAEVLLQPAAAIPVELWAALEARAPVALITRVDGPTAGPESIVVTADGRWTGAIAVGDPDALVAEAVALMGRGQRSTHRVEDGAGIVLVEAWVPTPRLVVVGAGELASAIDAQAALLGWETRAAPDLGGVDACLDWAGTSAAVVVLSHDPHLDVPAIGAALARDIAYLGTLGSRRTQSRRIDRLVADGVGDADVARIHRPVGLDLGGRSAPEVALSIVAEILAVRGGRDGRPLAQRDGPIHARPGA